MSTTSTGWERWRHLDRRTPVVAGVGRADQPPTEPGAGKDALGLMIEAATAAGDDCGAPGLLRRIDRVAVPEGSWKYRDAARLVARAVGAGGARTVVVRAGIPQQTLLDDAYLDLIAGRVDVALVVGGEAAGRATAAKRAGIELDDTVADDVDDPDELRQPEGETILSRAEIALGVYVPAQQYALIDSALRHAEGRTLDEHRDEIAGLWAGFSATAARFPHAAFREPRTAESIREPGPDNRPIAFPYNKWHCSQMNVDQAAAILVSTLEAAEAAGVDPDRVVFPRRRARVELHRPAPAPGRPVPVAGDGGPRPRRGPSISVSHSRTSSTSRSTAASRRRSGCSSVRSVCPSTASRRSPAASRSPAGRGTTSSSRRPSRWSSSSAPTRASGAW